MVTRLDLASGPKPAVGFIGVDIMPGGYVGRWADGDQIPRVARWRWDLDVMPWPWEDSSVEALRCSHFVEHAADLIAFMDEAWRIAAPGAPFEIVHPYQHSNRAWQDPTHRRALNEHSWDYFSAAWRKAQDLEHYPIRSDWERVEIGYSPSAEFAKLAPKMDEDTKAFVLRHCHNIIDDLIVRLRCVK